MKIIIKQTWFTGSNVTAAGLVDLLTNEKSASAGVPRERKPTSPYCCRVTNNM